VKSNVHQLADRLCRAYLDRAKPEVLLETVGRDASAGAWAEAQILYDRAEAGQAEWPPAMRRLTEALDAPPDHRELLAVLLAQWTHAALRCGNLSDANRGFQRVQEMSGGSFSPEVSAVVAITEYRILQARCKPHLALDALTRAKKLPLPPGTYWWYRIRHVHAQSAIYNNRFRLAEDDLAELVPYESRYSMSSLLLLRAHLCQASDRPEEGLRYLDRLDAVQPAFRPDLVLGFRLTLLSIAGRAEEARRLFAADEARPRPLLSRVATEHHRALIAMFACRLDEAREHLTGILARPNGCDVRDQEVVLVLLADCELASGSASAARRILRMVDTDRDRPDLRMCWVRLHLLEGDEPAAVRLFREVLRDTDDRSLAPQLRFAYDLSGYRLQRLRSLAAEEDDTPAPHRPAREPGAEVIYVGDSPASRDVRREIGRFARIDTAVLITGETGTGKEVVARLLHDKSDRAGKPFVPVNCGSMSDSLIESELFGHVKGAFTGADRDHDGLFVAAGVGTIFLDEVHAMSERLQNALIRVLEHFEIRPVGSNSYRPVKARIIAATNQSLEQAVAEGRFRQDLYYRLRRLHIEITPLRDRREDIPVLARHFLSRLYGQFEIALSEGLLRALTEYDWPGNVRELCNEIERMALLAGDQPVLGPELFHAPTRDAPAPAWLATATATTRPAPPAGPVRASADAPALPLSKTEQRRHQLRQLFREHGRLTRAQAVQLLNCAPKTATADLKLLEQESYIRRVHTSGHLRTSYFVLVLRDP